MVARAQPALAYHIRRVKTKMASGQYDMESVSCFCGSDDYVQATELDRYGIDYSMGICRSCGIMYSNRRLTEKSMRDFYAKDYRLIYDSHDDAGWPESKGGCICWLDYGIVLWIFLGKP